MVLVQAVSTERKAGGAHRQLLDHGAHLTRRARQAAAAPLQYASDSFHGSRVGKGVRHLTVDRALYGTRRKVAHPHHKHVNHEDDSMTAAEQHYWRQQKQQKRWEKRDRAAAKAEQEARARRPSRSHYEGRIKAARLQSQKYGWRDPDNPTQARTDL